MDLNQLANLGEFIGGVAVLVTLVYLAVQVRQTASWTKRQALDSVIDRFTTWAARVRDNPDIVDIYLRGADDFESFSPQERQRYHLTKMEIMASIETVLEHGKTQGIKEETTNAARRWVLQEVNGDGAKAWWEDMGRAIFSDDFGHTVDTLIREGDR